MLLILCLPFFFNSKEFSLWLILISITHKTWLFHRNIGAGREHLLRCSGYDKTSFNVVKTRFGKLFGPFKFIFDSSLEKGIFSVDSKIVGVTPVFKSGDCSDLETSELDQSHCFHAFPKHLSMFCLIVENKYLVENNFFL